jgi:hypothetical protein
MPLIPPLSALQAEVITTGIALAATVLMTVTVSPTAPATTDRPEARPSRRCVGEPTRECVSPVCGERGDTQAG